MRIKKTTIHKLIYINFLTGFSYAAIAAFNTPRTEILQRRLYALEAWIAFGFLAIYFALTNFKEKN